MFGDVNRKLVLSHSTLENIQMDIQRMGFTDERHRVEKEALSMVAPAMRVQHEF